MKNGPNDLHFPFHDRLLLEVTQANSNLAEIQTQLQQTVQKSSWEKLIKMAYQHAVIPQLHHVFSQSSTLIPDRSFKQVETLNREIIFENIKLGAELIKIVQMLEHDALPYLAIKGPTLAQDLYGDITKRQISDLDIFVPQEELLTIADRLFSMGYRSELPLKLLSNRGFLALDNDFTFLHYDKQIMVELHWKLFPSRHKMSLPFSTLYREKREIHIKSHPINVLSTEHNLLYLSLHASKHIFEQLKWVCDIDVLIRENPMLDFDAIINMAKTLDVLDAFVLALSMSHTLYKTPLPPTVTAHISSHTKTLCQEALRLMAEDFTALNEPQKKKIRYLFLQRLNHQKQHRIFAILLATFTPSSVDYIYYQLPERYNFLYPLLRPVRLIYKYGLKKLLS